MKEAASSRGGTYLPTDWLPYYLPCPPPEARQAFNEYVKCHWPIHVFAIDPITQDQNLADTYSRRQEMQLALSLAFASGSINARKVLTLRKELLERLYDNNDPAVVRFVRN